jgi:hypothetical protein
LYFEVQSPKKSDKSSLSREIFTEKEVLHPTSSRAPEVGGKQVQRPVPAAAQGA